MSWIPAIISALGSIGGGLFGSSGPASETKQQRQSRKVADQLLQSMQGNGPFSQLFNTDEEAFQKSFVDPAKNIFNNQIAPQIQQQYLSQGNQRNTGMADSLTRAGVDLDSLINQNYLTFQNQGKNNMANLLNSILNQGSGAQNDPTIWQKAAQATGGYLTSDKFGQDASNIYSSYNQNQAPQSQFQNGYIKQPTPKGYWNDYGI